MTKKNESMIEYLGLGGEDALLQKEITEIVAEYNASNNASLVFSMEIEDDLEEDEVEDYEGYWSVRDNDLGTGFHMFVFYDDEAHVIVRNLEEEALANRILDAMQESSNRDGYPESLRMSDYDEDGNPVTS